MKLATLSCPNNQKHWKWLKEPNTSSDWLKALKRPLVANKVQPSVSHLFSFPLNSLLVFVYSLSYHQHVYPFRIRHELKSIFKESLYDTDKVNRFNTKQ